MLISNIVKLLSILISSPLKCSLSVEINLCKNTFPIEHIDDDDNYQCIHPPPKKYSSVVETHFKDKFLLRNVNVRKR